MPLKAKPAESSNPTEAPSGASQHALRAYQYANDVITGKILACKWVKLACERHLSDLQRARSNDFPYKFDPAKAGRVCRFIEQLPHTKGDWALAIDGRDTRIKLEPWQCFIYANVFGWVHRSTGLRRYRIAYVCVPRKNGKALALDTPILTPSGWSTMGALRVGDFVFGPDGQPRKVVAATETLHGRPCYEVTFTDGESILADANHQWLTDARIDRDNKKGRAGKTAGPKPSIKTTAEIATTVFCRGERNHRIAVASPVQMPERNLPIHPYALGAWLGDGTAVCGELTVGIQDELETVQNIRACDELISKKRSAMCAYRFSDGDRSQKARNVSFAARLRQLNLLGNKHIPNEYLFASVSQRLALLQGLMDTDGSISKAGQCEFGTSNQTLLNGFLDLLRGLGFKPSYSACRAMLHGKDCGPFYRVQFWASDSRPVFRLKRKAARQRKLAMRSSYRQIISCKPIPSVPVRCIQVNAEDGLFLAGRSLVTTHNSIIAAGTGLYMFASDGEMGAEIYAGATCQRQAWEVFRPAKQMVERTPRLKEVFGIHIGARNLAILDNGSRFEPVVGKPGDGASPSCAIVDEYHEHRTDELVDTMRTGMGARKQPLLWIITTAGSNIAGPCHDLQREVEKVLEQSITREELFGIVYTIDEAEDDWTSEIALRKANPNFGVSVFEDFLLTEQAAAIQNSRKQNIFKTKHLNIWCGADVAWMNMQKWQALKDPSLSIEDFRGEPVWIGCDLAATVDITAAVQVFKRVIDEKEHYYVFGRYYLPRERAEDPDYQHYQQWLHDGRLIGTEGPIVDLELFREDLLADAERFQLQQIAFDQWNALQMQVEIQKALGEDKAVNVPMKTQFLSYPMKQLESLVLDGRIHHDGNPVLTWMMSNVVAHTDRNDNIFPNKENRANKIDGAVALIMALSRAIVETGPGFQEYNGF